MKKFFLVFGLIILLNNTSFAQSDYSLTGNCQFNSYYYPQQDEEYVPEGIINLKLKIYLNSSWQYKTELEGRYNNLELENGAVIEDQDYRPYFSIPEAYFAYLGKQTDFYIGVRKIDWGITDRFNPIDLINPIDLTDIIVDRKIGIPLLALNYYHQDLQIELVVAPYFVPSRLPPANSYFYYGQDLVIEKELPAFTFANVQAGLLLSWQYKNLKITGMGYYGYDHLPFIELEMLSLTDWQMIYHYEHMSAIGGGFEYAVDQLVFRGEGAYYFYPELEDQDYGQYVVGFDYNFGQIAESYGFYLTMQYIGESPEIEDPYWVRHIFTNAASAKLMFGNEFFETAIEGIYNFPDQGTVIIPSLSYSFPNDFSIKAEYNYFAGEENSFWDFNSQNERYILTLKYTF